MASCLKNIEILGKLTGAMNDIMANIRDIQFSRPTTSAGLSSGIRGIMDTILMLDTIESTGFYPSIVPMGELKPALTDLLAEIVQKCFSGKPYVRDIPVGLMDFQFLQDNEVRELLDIIQSQEPVPKERIHQLERFMRALARLFTIGELGSLAKRMSIAVWPFLMITDAQLGKGEYVLKEG